MKLFDLHCDTLSAAEARRLSPFFNDSLMLAFGRAPFACHRQVMAIWSSNTLDDEAAWENFQRILAYTEEEKKKTPLPPEFDPILAIEDARLVNGDLSRLDFLYEKGVRLLTLTWKGLSPIGGAWDTEEGLTPFGRELILHAASIGMAIDISHASDRLFYEALALVPEGQKTIRFLASHSNSRALCPHRRNLTDDMFRALTRKGSLVGISLVPQHLKENGSASLADVIGHFLHFLSLGGEDTLAFGSDFDGIDSLPDGITGVESLPFLYDTLAKETSPAIADKVFYENAERFFAPLL